VERELWGIANNEDEDEDEEEGECSSCVQGEKRRRSGIQW